LVSAAATITRANLDAHAEEETIRDRVLDGEVDDLGEDQPFLVPTLQS
jgi:hypothetical protein